MSDTFHHRNQRSQHEGESYGSRNRCNKNYIQPYSKEGRKVAASLMRMETKNIKREALRHGTEDG